MTQYIPKINRHAKSKMVREKVWIPDYFEKVIIPQMGSYYDNYEVNFEAKPVVCCPIHAEKTPSFRFYEESNSFYCFGCSRGGNVITLHRYFVESLTGEQPDYDETTELLYNIFIDETEDADEFLNYSSSENKVEDIKIGEDGGAILSKESELADYEMFIVELEGSISADEYIPISRKKEMYTIIDTTTNLLFTKHIGAKEAKQYIKDNIDNILRH